MTEEKFIEDSKTVTKFIQCYCDNEHFNAKKIKNFIPLTYKSKNLEQILPYELCNECENTLKYSYNRLQNCPNANKPSCRKCSIPCYDKREWKHLAKIMRYSGIKLGFIKLKKLFNRSR